MIAIIDKTVDCIRIITKLIKDIIPCKECVQLHNEKVLYTLKLIDSKLWDKTLRVTQYLIRACRIYMDDETSVEWRTLAPDLSYTLIPSIVSIMNPGKASRGDISSESCAALSGRAPRIHRGGYRRLPFGFTREPRLIFRDRTDSLDGTMTPLRCLIEILHWIFGAFRGNYWHNKGSSEIFQSSQLLIEF